MSIEKEMWDAADLLAKRVEIAVAADPDQDADTRELVNDVLRASKTFTERYRDYCEFLVKGAMGE